MKEPHLVDIKAVAILLLACAIFSLPSMLHRSIWYDEAITLISTAGHPSPDWPKTPQPAAGLKKQFIGKPSLAALSKILKISDIHPPLYFWSLSKWRQLFGFSIESARIHSLAYFLIGIIFLYRLLRKGNLRRPFLPVLMYGITYSAAHFSGEARAYALANTLVILASYCAYESTCEGTENKRPAIYYAVAMAVASAAAILTNYLTLFSVVAIMAWFLWHQCIASKGPGRAYALAYPLFSFTLCLWWAPVLVKHLGARPHQAAGFIGPYSEAIKIAWMNFLGLFSFNPNHFESLFSLKPNLIIYQGFIIIFILLLMVTTAIYCTRNMTGMNKKLFSLFLLLAIAPSAGLFLLDLFFDKNLSAIRYAFFGLFPMVVLLYWGVSHQRSRAAVIVIMLVAIILQVLGNNWTSVRANNQNGSSWRTLSKVLDQRGEDNDIVAIMAGFGRGIPSAVIYELNENQTILVVDKTDDPAELFNTLKNFNALWFVLAYDDPAYRKFQSNLITRFIENPDWQLVDNQKGFLGLKKSGPH